MKTYIINVILCLLLMNGFFFASLGKDASQVQTFIIQSLVCGAAVFLVQLLTKRQFFHKRHAAPLFVMAWWYLYIIIKYNFLNASAVNDYADELIAGTGGAAGFVLLQFICEQYISRSIAFIVVDFLEFAFCIPPIMSVLHHFLYRALITFDEIIAILNTDSREAKEWFVAYVGWGNITLCFAGILVVFLFIHWLRVWSLQEEHERRKLSVVLLSLVLMPAVWFLPWKAWNHTDFVKPFTGAVKYLHALPHYGELSAKRLAETRLDSSVPVSGEPHTVIMVIGESAGRDHVKAYNDDVPFDNSPWLSSHKNDGDFIIFQNAYACQSLTQQALENALTEKSYYNDKEFLESMNIIDIARKKGYKTYWFTNLGDDNKGSSFFHVSARSDVFVNVPRKYDGEMLQELARINPAENNFIVLHGFGSHVVYKERYPADRAVFPGDTVEAEYSNAIRYTDDFLRDVFAYGREKLNLKVMLYYSDHGENLRTGHAPGDHDFIKARIPMFVYMDAEYQRNNEENYSKLLSNKDEFFTNDMIYNTLSGILNAESNFYNAEEDLSSPAYGHKLEDLWTFAKTVRVRDDPALNKN